MGTGDERTPTEGASFETVDEPVSGGGRPTSGPDPDLERRLGSWWLPRIGILILVLGLVFLIAHAIDEGWISRPMQIALGTVGGLSLAIVGDVLDRLDRHGPYPQILIAGGASVVYFALFSAYAFESYRRVTGFSIELTFGLLALAALGLGLYAAVRDLPVLAGQAIFLTAITSHMPGEEVAYLRVLQMAGLSSALALAGAARRWKAALVTNGLVTFAALILFVPRGVDPAAVLVGAAVAVPGLVLASLRLREAERGRDDLLTVQAGVPILGCWIVGLLAMDAGGWAAHQGWLTLGVGLTGCALALIPLPSPTRLGWAATGTTILVAWPPIHFDGTAVAGLWVAGLALTLVAQHLLRSDRVRFATVAIGALLTTHLFVVDAPRVADGSLDPALGGVLFVAAAAVMLASWHDARSRPATAWMASGYLLVGTVLPLAYAALAMDGYGITIAWAVEGLVVVLAGFLLAGSKARLAGLAVLALVVGRVFFVDMASLDVVYRIVTFIVVGLLLLAASFLYVEFLPDEEPVTEESA